MKLRRIEEPVFRYMHRSGFTLVELIPAIAMISVILLISMKSILLNQRMRDQSVKKSDVIESYKLVQNVWRTDPGTALVCRKMESGQWEIMNFPNETWIPDSGNIGNSIEWRRRNDSERSVPVVVAEYRLPGEIQWTWWLATVEEWYEES